MKKLQRIALGLAFAALAAAGGVTASAKSSSKQVLTGVVRSVNLSERTIEVREEGSKRTLTVRVPEGNTLRTNLASSPSLPIERLLPGMVVRDIVVQ